jgi:hypothetical protein
MYADFLAERGEEASREEILMVVHCLEHLLLREYQARLTGQDKGREVQALRNF